MRLWRVRVSILELKTKQIPKRGWHGISERIEKYMEYWICFGVGKKLALRLAHKLRYGDHDLHKTEAKEE